MIDCDLGRQSHPPAAVPHGVPFCALNEQIAFSGVVVCRRNGQGIKMPAFNVFLDTVAVEMGMEEVPQRSSIQKRPGVPASENGAKGEIHDPRNGVAGLREDITAEDVGRLQVRPQTGQNLSRQRKVAATHGKPGTINGSRGSATDDRKRIAEVLNAWYLPNALEDP